MFPQGTVTFLFTDIEGSTRRWEDRPDAMRDALHRHDEAMRACIERNRGVVFKTIGDAFCAAFPTASDGVAAALDAQRTIAGTDWDSVGGLRVRMALHAGEVEHRDGDYFGPPVNRVARLLAAGHGGQVLLSAAAARLVRDVLPAGAMLRDLGEHRLKDLTSPEHVAQLLAGDLPGDFPPIRSLDVTSNNLPIALTHLVGRRREVVEIEAALGEARLVTILGIGGVGKTRCALQAASEVLEDMADGVWFVDLAPVRDASLVSDALASTLDVDTGNSDPLESVVAHLRSKTLLLILDNCEHVVAEAARCVDAILRAAAGVRVLATSREPIGVHGEHAYRLGTLAVPAAATKLAASDASDYGALALFETRARAHDAKFAITDENVATVAEICRRLDGIALAIELAAARVKMLPVKALAQKLDERFRILTSNSRTALPRQQTMRALFDWSYDLLSDDERAVFRRLSVFAGDFGLEPATSVGCGDSIEEYEAFDLLASLVEKSLVVTEPLGEETRYRLLESTRQYAREKLGEGEEAVRAQRAHAGAMLALAKLLAELDPRRDRWSDAAAREMDNWRVALAWAFGKDGDLSTGARLVAAMGPALLLMPAIERRRWFDAAIGAAEASTEERNLLARLLYGRGRLEMTFANYATAVGYLERSLAAFETLGDPEGLALAQQGLGASLVMRGRVAEGEPLVRQALAAHRALGISSNLAFALQDYGNTCKIVGDVERALELYAESMEILRAAGNETAIGPLLENLAELHLQAGDTAAAIADAEEAIEIYRRDGMEANVTSVHCNLAAYLIALGRYDEARERGRARLLEARETGLIVHATVLLQHLAAAAALRTGASRKQLETAARLLGFVDGRLSALDAAREHTELQELERLESVLAAAFGDTERAALSASGAQWSEDQACEAALAL